MTIDDAMYARFVSIASSTSAEFALMREGFTHGGQSHNYCRDDLPADATYLARLTDELFTTAYDVESPRRPAIRTTNSTAAVWADRRGQLLLLNPPSKPRRDVCPCGYEHKDEPPLETSPGLAARALRALRSNFMSIHVDCEDRQHFRIAVEGVRTFDKLPDWAQDYILKAEEGPLW